MDRASTRLARTETVISRIPFSVFVVLLILTSLIKHGVRLESPFDFRVPQPPNLVTWLGSPYVFVVDLTQGNSLLFHGTAFVMSVAILVLASVLLRRRLGSDTARVSITLVILGPIGLSLIHQVARDDSWLILGVVVLMLTSFRSWPLWVLGAALMSAGNPAQAAVGAATLLALSFVGPFCRFRARALVAMVVSTGWLILSSTLESSNQLTAFSALLWDSMVASLTEGLLRFYSIYGALWLLIFLVLLNLRSRELPLAVIALVAFPLGITLLTLDGWRVGVAITAPMLFAVLLTFLPKFVEMFRTRVGPWPLTAALAIMFIIPSLSVGYSQITTGHFTLPGTWILELFFSF